jgi:predicted secreted protein
MRSRQVNFFVGEERLSEVMEAVTNDVVPRFRELPHFLGLTVLKGDGVRRAELLATSYWDDGLEDSEAISMEFMDEIYRATGTNPSVKAYDIVFAAVRCSDGTFDLRPSNGLPY